MHLILPLCREKERHVSGMSYVSLTHVMGRPVSGHRVGSIFLPLLPFRSVLAHGSEHMGPSDDFDGPDGQVW